MTGIPLAFCHKKKLNSLLASGECQTARVQVKEIVRASCIFHACELPRVQPPPGLILSAMCGMRQRNCGTYPLYLGEGLDSAPFDFNLLDSASRIKFMRLIGFVYAVEVAGFAFCASDN
jgi:hypothetical protein